MSKPAILLYFGKCPLPFLPLHLQIHPTHTDWLFLSYPKVMSEWWLVPCKENSWGGERGRQQEELKTKNKKNFIYDF